MRYTSGSEAVGQKTPAPTIVRLRRRSMRRGYDPSRHYYDARNAAFTAWHTLGSLRAVLFHLTRQCRLATSALLYEDQKWRRLQLRTRGTIDGFRGRLGRRNDLE